MLRVLVLRDGLEFDGNRYKSLSAVAKAITGTHCNGYRFFSWRTNDDAKIQPEEKRRATSCAAPSTPGNLRRRGSNRSSTPSMPNGNRPRHTSPARRMRAGMPPRALRRWRFHRRQHGPASSETPDDDIEAGKVDCVVVYKVDRLSRSLLDFARMMEIFESTTSRSSPSRNSSIRPPQWDDWSSMSSCHSPSSSGRSLANESVTRSLPSAAKANGQAACRFWATTLTDPTAAQIGVNAEEAVRVRQIFDLYLQLESLLPVVDELGRRGWCNKSWKTKKGTPKGGVAFDKCSLHNLLTNPIYIGKIKHKTDFYDGEHEPIVSPDVFGRVQNMLQRNGRTGGATCATATAPCLRA